MRPLAILLLVVSSLITPTAARAQASGEAGSQLLPSLELLPRFKPWRVGSVSSYDRSGGNDDGFNGTYSYVRKEAGGLVIADLKGPGVVTRIWTPTPNDSPVEFYFDGEKKPRLTVKFSEIFSGKKAPFLAPLSGLGAGGFYSYVPLAYARSLKILVRAERVEFYQLNFASLPEGTRLESFSPARASAPAPALEAARELIGATGSDVAARAAGKSGTLSRRAFQGTLAAGGKLTLFETDQPGRIVGLRLGPAEAFAGKGRDVTIRIFYDGDTEPAIWAPVGDFFGYAWGEPAVRSLPLGTAGGMNYIYLPMPFDRSARVELVSERPSGAIEVSGEVAFTNAARRPDEGKLYALWRRENPTTEGKPFTFLDTGGRGHLVGAILQAQGMQPGAVPEFFEGDDETIIDGQPAIRGTGSEDFFNGGWYDVPGRWESRVSLPLSGSLDFKRHLARTGGYRFLLSDAYPYRSSIVSTIEHGPSGNKIPTDYVSVTFFYSAERPTANLALPPVERRRVMDPTTAVFTPGWTTPIHSFSWSNATLAKLDEKVDGENLRHLSLDAQGREVFGPHYLSFICEMPAAGRYRVSLQVITGPDQGIVQLFRDEVGMGPAADLYSPERHKSAEISMGELELDEGPNRVMFKLVGQNPASSGSGIDIYRIVFEKVK
jgi:hypothetical protein